MKAVIIIATPCSLTLHGKWEKEGKFGGTGILFEEPNPTGSRPSDLIGLYTKWQRAKRPQPAKRSSREEGGATGADLFKRETEHLCIRPPIHGIGRDPLTRE